MTLMSFESLQQLPIYQRQQDIISSVDSNQVTIITAETGAGKSTQVPQFLAEHGYRKVIVTQPRILAARNLSNRVRQEYSWRISQDATKLVGYRTAHERDDDPDNVILYCTDGLQLVRELTGSGTGERQVLILDEIHEWNENMEVLIAWAKKRCREDPHFKVVLMSATIEAEHLATYLDAPAPITVTGRTHPVEKRHGEDLITEVINQLETRTSNMLVFLPGKAEIEAVAEAIQKTAKTVPVIPLHSQLEPEVQQLAFRSYPQGKVVLTTNVAQTSITIDDIDTVIDSGLERRAEVRSGVEGLFIEQISQADCLQRAGRAGRTKAGLYILAPLVPMPCAPFEERPPYGIPEILRKHVDRLTLRLANIGIDIEGLDFYHAPSTKTIKLAKRTLVSLGAITGNGTVTAIGRSMERFPVESSFARMLVEAEQYSSTIQAKLATIIAIQEVGGLVKGSTRYTGWRRYTSRTNSDLLAQYDVYLALPNINPDDHEEFGIISKNATKAAEVNERLNRDLGLGDVILEPIVDDEVDQLLQCIVAGQLHEIWAVEPTGDVIHIATKRVRRLSSGTVVRHAGLVTGTPFDLQVPTAQGLETLHLVNDVTAVNPEWLQKLAPELFIIRPGKVYFDSHFGTLAQRMLVKFNGRTFSTSGTPVLEHTPQNQRQFLLLYSSWLHGQLETARQLLQSANSKPVPHIPLSQVKDRVQYIAPAAVSLLELDKKQRIDLIRLTKPDTFFGDRFMATLHTPKPHGSRHDQPGSHKRHRGWQPPHKRKRSRQHHHDE